MWHLDPALDVITSDGFDYEQPSIYGWLKIPILYLLHCLSFWTNVLSLWGEPLHPNIYVERGPVMPGKLKGTLKPCTKALNPGLRDEYPRYKTQLHGRNFASYISDTFHTWQHEAGKRWMPVFLNYKSVDQISILKHQVKRPFLKLSKSAIYWKFCLVKIPFLNCPSCKNAFFKPFKDQVRAPFSNSLPSENLFLKSSKYADPNSSPGIMPF